MADEAKKATAVYKFVKDTEYPAEHALAGNYKEGQEIELDLDVAKPFVEEGVLVVLEPKAAAEGGATAAAAE